MNTKPEPSTKSILDMTADESRNFLLKPASYCSIDLPGYIDFAGVLDATVKALGSDQLASMRKKEPRDVVDVSYTLYANKDGRYSWRPFEIIHPALYVSLVNALTKDTHWKTIKDRFQNFAASPRIDCLSVPIESHTKRSDQAEQVTQWWQGIEQRSVVLSLDYQCVFHADISDCYGSIYTHSIPWAVHTREVAKGNRDDLELVGNVIDRSIQDMRESQTNGIPQGSVLMDFIAEIVLGHADELLSKNLEEKGVSDYQILRYRDDYRVFVNNPEDGELILRILTEVLIDLGLKLNATKTSHALPVIPASLKADKWAWLLHKQRDLNLQKHLLGIHAHGTEYPNAGSLMIAMSGFHKRLMRYRQIQQPLPLIGIALDIAYHSPRVFPACAAVISRLLQELDTDQERQVVLEKILNRIRKLPNTGTMEVWLQRISLPIRANLEYKEKLCKLVQYPGDSLWNNDWISSKKLLRALKHDIVDRDALREMSVVVKPNEIDLFSYE